MPWRTSWQTRAQPTRWRTVCPQGPDDLRFLVIDPLTGFTPKELLVAVASELFWKSSSVCAELLQGLNDGRQHERPHAVEPQVLGGSVNKEDGVAESQLADGVAKNNVEVEFVQAVLGRKQGLSTVAFGDIGKLPDGGAGFAAPDELGVLGRLTKLLVIPKPSVSKNVVFLVGGEVLQGFGRIGGVAWAHVRRWSGGVG